MAAYEAASDMDSVVRLCLERLNAPQRAYAIARKTQSVEAANQLSRFCLQTQDFQVGGLGDGVVGVGWVGGEGVCSIVLAYGSRCVAACGWVGRGVGRISVRRR